MHQIKLQTSNLTHHHIKLSSIQKFSLSRERSVIVANRLRCEVASVSFHDVLYGGFHVVSFPDFLFHKFTQQRFLLIIQKFSPFPRSLFFHSHIRLHPFFLCNTTRTQVPTLYKRTYSFAPQFAQCTNHHHPPLSSEHFTVCSLRMVHGEPSRRLSISMCICVSQFR